MFLIFFFQLVQKFQNGIILYYLFTTNFLNYANPIVTERNSNSKKLAKFNKQQAKNQTKRAKDIAQYKSTGLSGWDTSYQLLQSFTQTK